MARIIHNFVPHRRATTMLIVAMLAGVLWLCPHAGAEHAAAKPQPEPALNPHHVKDACGSCHGEQPKPASITAEKAEAACLACHDGVRATRESHAIGVKFDATHFTHRNWPLIRGQLTCVTCHDMKAACTGDLEDRTNRNFLRDHDAARNKLQPFCLNCHQEPAYQKVNPHLMLDRTGGKTRVNEETCLICHLRLNDRTVVVRTERPHLKADAITLCRDCHPRHINMMPEKHVGMPIPAEMRARMVVREMIGLGSTPTHAMVADVQHSGKKPTVLRPGPNNIMTCTTCHNPHQSGVFPRDNETAHGAMQLKDDGHLISPVRNEAWCKYCHEF